jgi:hypothetical protein
MKKILLYLIVSLLFLNNVQADCDSCRMYCADMHRYDNNYSSCANCNSCVQDLCYNCSWCGGRNTIEDVNTSARFCINGGLIYPGAGGPVCWNDNNQQMAVNPLTAPTPTC